MKIVFFSFYYPPDLSAGSFRSVALAQAMAKKLGDNDELHIITTHPNRYAQYREKVKDFEVDIISLSHNFVNIIFKSQTYNYTLFLMSLYFILIYSLNIYKIQ